MHRGVTLAPVVGRILADLAISGSTRTTSIHIASHVSPILTDHGEAQETFYAG